MRHLLSKNQQMKHIHLLKHEMKQSFHSENILSPEIQTPNYSHLYHTHYCVDHLQMH